MFNELASWYHVWLVACYMPWVDQQSVMLAYRPAVSDIFPMITGV